MAKHKSNAIKIQIQGSQSNINGTIDNDMARNYRRHISFDDSCKKDDGDEVCVQIKTKSKKKIINMEHSKNPKLPIQ